jgi:hypothetical protein
VASRCDTLHACVLSVLACRLHAVLHMMFHTCAGADQQASYIKPDQLCNILLRADVSVQAAAV